MDMSDPDGATVSRRTVLYGTTGILSAGAVTTGGPVELVSTARGSEHVPDRIVCAGSEDGTLYGVDVETGEPVWTVSEPADAIASSPTAVDGTVYVGSDDGTLYAVDATEGETVWTFDAEGGPIVSSPTVVGGTVYVGTGSGAVVAVDRTTGEQRWRFDETTAPINGAPTVIDGTAYVGSDAGTLFALETTAGDVRWETTLGDTIASSPTVRDGTLYVGSFDEQAYAIEVADGSIDWSTDLGDIVFASPTVVEETVYIGTAGFGTGLHALDTETGERRWTADGPAGVASSPTAHVGTVYVGSVDGRVYAVDSETGETAWETNELASQVTSSPTVLAGTLYVGSTDGSIHAVDIDTGEERWRFDDPEGEVFSSPTVVDIAGDGHGIGSRAELGTLGHHHVWAAVPFEGDPDREDGGEDAAGSGTDSDENGETADDDEGESDSGPTDDDATAATTPTPDDGPGFSTLELLSAAGGIGVTAFAAYRFLGSGSSDSDGTTGSVKSSSGRAAETSSAGAATDDMGQTTDTRPPGKTEGERSSDAAIGDETGSEGTQTADQGTGSTPAMDEPVPEQTSDEGTADERAAAAGGTTIKGGATAEEAADPGTVPRNSTADRLVAAIDQLRSAKPIETGGPLTAYAVTDDRIDGHGGNGNDGRGRVLALPTAGAEGEEDGEAFEGIEEAFEEVATDWGSVSHYEGTVTVYDSGTEPFPWVLTDPVHGVRSLADQLTDPPESVVARVSPVVDAAEAISQASRYTVRHYYLSPKHVRVMETPDGRSGVVDDWGLSAVPEYADRGTRGSTPYTAPEQLPDSDDPLWRGKPDTYALGALAYHAATGEPPAADRPANPSDLADVPTALDRPITRALDPDPDERHGSVGGFARALRLALFD